MKVDLLLSQNIFNKLNLTISEAGAVFRYRWVRSATFIWLYVRVNLDVRTTINHTSASWDTANNNNLKNNAREDKQFLKDHCVRVETRCRHIGYYFQNTCPFVSTFRQTDDIGTGLRV